MVGTKRVTIQEKTDVTESSRRQKTDTEDSSNVNELALEIVKRAIAAAIKFVEETKNPIKNIQWLTHGEFTAEKGRRQIEKFVLDMPIEVSYVFEGHSLVHRPGMTRFREKWLRDITEAKSILMESIAFFNGV
uniref:A-kinase anchoring protein 14 n=1 Tax=Lynx canadensis TaxID=61383 RepID=A0A667HYR3_LYNCA